mgnify:CR=1 FL=1
MKLKLCFSALCAAAVILLASPAAYADSYDLSLGSISIDSTASGQTVVQNGKTAVDPAPVITQKSAEATQNTLMAGRVPGIEKSAGGWLEIAGEDDAVLNTTGSPGIGSGFMASDADGKEIPPDYSALRKGGLVEFFDPDGKLLRSYSLDTPSGVLK